MIATHTHVHAHTVMHGTQWCKVVKRHAELTDEKVTLLARAVYAKIRFYHQVTTLRSAFYEAAQHEWRCSVDKG